MQSSESLQKIAQAIADAQAEFKSVGMSGDNKFDRYTYAKLEDYVAAIKPILPKHGLSLITSVDEVVALNDRPTKNDGVQHAVRVKLTMRLMHTSGEWIETSSWGEGQDRADKAVYKAVTGGRKYALASALGLATGDDPENDEGTAGQGSTARPAAKQPVKQAAGKPATKSEPLSPQLQGWLKAYVDAAASQSVTVEMAHAVLRKMLAAKKIKLADTTDEQREAILTQVRAGEWAKYFTPPVPQHKTAA